MNVLPKRDQQLRSPDRGADHHGEESRRLRPPGPGDRGSPSSTTPSPWKRPTQLALIADASERPVSEIQELNPSLLKTLCSHRLSIALAQGHCAGSHDGLGYGSVTHRANWRVHRVEPGETLTEIARRFSTAPASISAVNEQLMILRKPATCWSFRPCIALPILTARPAETTTHRKTCATRFCCAPGAEITASAPKTPATPYKTASLGANSARRLTEPPCAATRCAPICGPKNPHIALAFRSKRVILGCG